MTDPKPVKMWAPVHPEYGMAIPGLKESEAGAKNYIRAYTHKSWSEAEAAGYRCIRVTITPDPESEK